MSEPSKVIILPQENAKLVSEIRGRDETTNRILKITELPLKVIKLNMDNQDMKKRLAYYENLYSSPSGNIPARKKVRKKKYFKRTSVTI